MSNGALRCVIDTNVACTANGANPEAGVICMAASARALQAVIASGHVFIDHDGLIVGEYRANLAPFGRQPGAGDAFLKWLLTSEWSGLRVTRVPLTVADDGEGFVELPPPPEGVVYDRSDKVFLAVSAAHDEHPPILQSFDSKWWGWRAALEQHGVHIHFLCPDEIARKHAAKMG